MSLCTECREPVSEPRIAWDGGAFEGEPIHERCVDAARRRMYDEAAQVHHDHIQAINEQISLLRANFGVKDETP